ncbi:DUF3667 domain-containing protein [Flavobacterium sp. SM2513]|uniref:DUF3667 domain-containing protein n=1 Tax=Flavobacterium sp. SM2513 TaxID=3424766 RepID=UPI003D7F67E4
MEATCLNCNTEIAQNFCANCGQKKYKRIDRKYIWDEVQYSTVHMNKGFFYSLKNTLKNPGKTARTFIDGNRVNHYKPIALAFILSGISAFISFKIVGLGDMMNAMQDEQIAKSDMMKDINAFNQTYNSLIFLALIPFFALFTKWSFKSWGHNFYEHVVMNAFILAYYNSITIILFYPLMFLFKDNESMVMIMTSIATLSFLIIIPYFFKEFYKEYPFKQVLKRFLIFVVLAFIFSAILFVAAIFGYIMYQATFHPEALKQFAPPPKP